MFCHSSSAKSPRRRRGAPDVVDRIAQRVSESEEETSPLRSPWRRPSMAKAREGGTRPPPVPKRRLQRAGGGRRGGPSRSTRTQHSRGGWSEKRRARPGPTGPTARRGEGPRRRRRTPAERGPDPGPRALQWPACFPPKWNFSTGYALETSTDSHSIMHA